MSMLNRIDFDFAGGQSKKPRRSHAYAHGFGDGTMGWTPEQKARFEELMADPALSIADVLAGLLPPTPEQLSQLDENGDWIEEPEGLSSSGTSGGALPGSSAG
ncbi:hypothetical protein NA633_07245 [Pseudomonas stutzeri]|uniref:hypothetical protein n=1 Tax=Stutzerimonas stutzeri TaxID=316 RepID=UPI0011871BCB|nr:hypothetical protein [Stutzerimonas stutzeri]MCQ4282890.1 hypothetical protein [Stutzerimonas stutzeri]